MSGSRLPDCSKLVINWKNDNEVTICQHDVINKLFKVFLFLFSILVTTTSFMSTSSLVLELWQFTFIRDWPEIRKLEIPPSEFFPISGDQGDSGIPNLTWMPCIQWGGGGVWSSKINQVINSVSDEFMTVVCIYYSIV